MKIQGNKFAKCNQEDCGLELPFVTNTSEVKEKER